ncbi:molybdate ABC transporter substrate-binding protein [Brevundimonas sp.]|uniref:molybdate ABC transporter substrate-binding protein n=1 Tax=Brevundimonas sp. TaxID=1871086 RepID=UPI003F714CEE
MANARGIGRRNGVMLLAATVLAGCAPRRRAGPAPIDLFAAASLREVLDAALADHRGRSGRTVRAIYAGSAQLARQIEQGAPADLFVSADEVWMDWLERRGLIETAARCRLASNTLVLIVPDATPLTSVNLASPTDLAAQLGDGRLAIAEANVPAGRYGREALTRLNLWQSVADRLAPGGDVRAALALVARGEAPLGVVYATDARAEPRVRVVAVFPAASHALITYSAAPVQRQDGAGDPAAAKAFLDFLNGADGQALFRRFGFAPAPV